MIRVDPRAGSGPYIEPLQHLFGSGVKVRKSRLEFGDVSFLGYGPDGTRSHRIGIEIKTTNDMLNSLADGRLVAHQLVGMLPAYDQCYLLMAGKWRAGRDGSLQVPTRAGWKAAGYGSRRWNYKRFIRSMTSMATQAGVPWLRANSKFEALHMLAGLYSWWQTPWHEHSTCKQFHVTPPERVLHIKPGKIRTFAAAIPDIGWEFSYACEDMFSTIHEMTGAPAVVWADLRPPGRTAKGNPRRRLGPKVALRVVRYLQERS